MNFRCARSSIFTIKKLLFFLLGFTPCKAEQPLRGMELQAQKRLHDTENLFRKNLQLKDVCQFWT